MCFVLIVYIRLQKNWILKFIAIFFLTIWSDLICPCWTTTYPSEHSITRFRGVICGFTVHEFISSIKKLDCMWSAMLQSSLSCVHSPNKTGIYVATIDISVMKKEVKLQSVPVHIEIYASKIELLKIGYENWCVKYIIWK